MVQVHICSTKRRLDLDQSAARQPVLSIHEQPEDSRDLLVLDTCGPGPPIDSEGETNPNPKANFQKISECQRHNAQMLFSEIRFTEIKASLTDDPNISRQVKHRIQVASQPGSGTASLVVPTEKCSEMGDAATLQAICCRLGLAIPG